MTEEAKNEIEAYTLAIGRLVIARKKAHGNDEEQERIGAKLTKLYDLKRLRIQQEMAKENLQKK